MKIEYLKAFVLTVLTVPLLGCFDSNTTKIATKDSPYQNNLGMKFVPVPGTEVLFSVWDTRVRDFSDFVSATGYNSGTKWKNPGFAQTDNNPVVNVIWDDAKAFCKWLTEKERKEGKIAGDQEYRLPTEEEWSVAVGSGKYPWGNEWPPPKGAGNYDRVMGVDSYDKTSPAGSFPENRFGLYDMGGNVSQWCEDLYLGNMNGTGRVEKYAFIKEDGGAREFRVCRGGAYYYTDPVLMSSSSHQCIPAEAQRSPYYGFRCVLTCSPNK
jgi:formylglycine-generating enzyme required for sulfatase activity